MSTLNEHPTARRLLEKTRSVQATEPRRLRKDELSRLALECGADDCGLVSIDDPALELDRQYALLAFPATRVLLALVCRMHREPVRSAARSVANLEFHRAGNAVDKTAGQIVR